MRAARRCLLCLSLILVALQTAAAPRAKHVVIISLDGGNPTILRESRIPTIERLAREGAYTWSAQTVFPSITLVSHASMLTGVKPDKHGISWNDWLPVKGLPKAPTLFSIARERHVSTALFAGKEKFAHLLEPNSLDYLAIAKQGARQLAVEAARYITDFKPGICFVHFTDTDSTGHAYGWGSPEQKRAFADEDAGIATIRRAIARAGMASDTVLIVTADHGGHAKTHGSADPSDMTIPWVAWGGPVQRGHQITTPVMTCDTTATALWLLDIPLPAELDGRPVTEAFAESAPGPK